MMICVTREAKSALSTYPEIFTEQIWRKGREELSPEAYFHSLFNMTPPPPKIFPNQLIATGAKFYGVSIFCGWSGSPPRSFMGIKAQSVMCGTVVVSLSLFVFGERRLWLNSNMLED